MQEKLPGTENISALAERRSSPRFRVTSLVYIDIGSVNGGIVTSLSESGLALTAATALGNGEMEDGPVHMRVQFPGISEVIEASGQIVWTSSSGKKACLRFVDLEDKAREQIRGWISAQTSSNELRPEPLQLPKMQLPSSRRANPRKPRFSFADVASSRVDAESETGVDDFPEVIRQPGDLPPLQAGTNVFRDGTEVVASAFESPAFTEDQTRNFGSWKQPATSPAPDEQAQQHASPAIPERRQHPRRQIVLFTYAVLGEDNGGLVFNLGEGGLALTAAAPLQDDHCNKIRVRFPDSEDWIDTNGRLAWRSDSGKEAGIEFVGLPEDARARIREWVSQGEPADDFRLGEGEARTSQNPVQELPSFMEPEAASADPTETSASFEEQPFENQALEERPLENAASASASSSALFKTGIKGILERASVRRRVANIRPPRLADHAARPGTRVASRVLSIAAGVALAVGGWIFFRRNPSNEASGIIAQTASNPPSLTEAAQKPNAAKTEIGAAVPATGPRVHSNENNSTQTRIAKPSVPQTHSAEPNVSKLTVSPGVDFGRAANGKLGTERAMANLPPNVGQSQRQRPSGRKQETKSPKLTASAPNSSPENNPAENKTIETKAAETKPAENRAVQVAQALPTFNATKDANAPPLTLNSNPPQPAAALPANVEKEKPLITLKQPEAPVVRTTVVNVSFDPYPSIRMPKEGSKKSHQGKNLQMGRLLSRVDPVYPEEAKQQGVEGTVRVHAIFNRDGAVQSVISVSGPPLLVPAAMKAVRQWRYSQTILGGQAMETEEDVTLVFRLANSGSKD